MVGTRTWGGVVGIDSRYRLVDGTLVTQPKYAFWLEGYGWGVENHGVDPDVEVVLRPAGPRGRPGPQLDEAVSLALAALEATPAKTARRPAAAADRTAARPVGSAARSGPGAAAPGSMPPY